MARKHVAFAYAEPRSKQSILENKSAWWATRHLIKWPRQTEFTKVSSCKEMAMRLEDTWKAQLLAMMQESRSVLVLMTLDFIGR